MQLLPVTLGKSQSFPELLSSSRVSIPPDSSLLDSSFLALLILFFSFMPELVALATPTVFFVFLDGSSSSEQAVETCPLRLQLKQCPLQRNQLYSKLPSRQGFLDLPVYSTPSMASVTGKGDRRLEYILPV
jgi:hypothetical protein